MYKILQFNFFFFLCSLVVTIKILREIPWRKYFLECMWWTCFAFQLEVCISFCTVLSNHRAFFTFRSLWLSLLGERFLYMIRDKSQILGWIWSEVNKAKLNCLKYVWDTQIYVLVSSTFGGNKVMLCCLTPMLKEHWEHFSYRAFFHPFFLFVWYFWRWILKSMSSSGNSGLISFLLSVVLVNAEQIHPL